MRAKGPVLAMSSEDCANRKPDLRLDAGVLQAEIGAGPMPLLTTTSSTAGGAARSWKSTDAFIHEVAQARIYDGVHYRFSTEVGTAMGKQIGALAVTKFLRAAD